MHLERPRRLASPFTKGFSLVLVGSLLSACSPSGACPPAAPATSGTRAHTEFPEFVLEQGELQVLIYPPDPAIGHYRGPRFDWSGMVGAIRVGSHTFVQNWQKKHDPVVPDAVNGPAEEFGIETPLGYDSAAPGATFIKIGVGELRRINQEPYFFGEEYPVVRALPWRVQHNRTSAGFSQELPLTRGYGYQYKKQLTLEPDGRTLSIQHWLKNTGIVPIITNHYAHNFLRLDGQMIGPSYRVTFDSPVSGEIQPARLVERTGNVVQVVAPLLARESLFGNLTLEPSVDSFSFTVENTQVGSKVRISGDFGPEKFSIWALREVFCPEVFIKIQLPPGAEKIWTTRYEFIVPPPLPDE